MNTDTKLITAGRHPENNNGAVNTPVYRYSTVIYENIADQQARQAARVGRNEPAVYYGRRGTPTSFALSEAIAELENGYATALFPSGLAAISASLQAFLSQGDHLLMPESIYAPARQFASTFLSRFGVETSFYDPLIGAGIAELIRPSTKIVYLESPGSHTFEMQDIPVLVDAAHTAGALVMMDNTWATPIFYRPLDHGVDISIQAATKYIVGHSDVMMGAVTTTKELWPQLDNTASLIGHSVSPDDAYLAHRGLRTMGVRLQRHGESALRLANWLQQRPEVDRVLYPPLPGDPGHALWKRDFTGGSGLLGLVLQPIAQEAVLKMIESMELFSLGGSWGGYESLVYPSGPLSHPSARPVDGEKPAIRLHVGLEDPDDLIADLTHGFHTLASAG